MRRGERVIGGRIYLLAYAGPCWQWDEAFVAGEALALRRRYASVRVCRNRRRCAVYIYVFGSK